VRVTERFVRVNVQPEILFLSLLEGTMATSSRIRLLVLYARWNCQSTTDAVDESRVASDSLEVQSQPGVVLLNQSPGSLLDGLSPDTTLIEHERRGEMISCNSAEQGRGGRAKRREGGDSSTKDRTEGVERGDVCVHAQRWVSGVSRSDGPGSEVRRFVVRRGSCSWLMNELTVTQPATKLGQGYETY
jgi:hypothetical protein